MAGLNEALRAKAAGVKLLRTARVRAGTTVIAANVVYPADAGLLAKAVGKLVRAARRVKAAGGAAGTVMTGPRRAAGRRARNMAATMRIRAKLGRDESSRVMGRMTGDLADLAETAAAQAAAVLRNGRRVGACPDRADAGPAAADQRAAGHHQADRHGGGAGPGPAGRADAKRRDPAGHLHDPDARPIRKSRIDRPVEFGYKAQVLDNDNGVVVGLQRGTRRRP